MKPAVIVDLARDGISAKEPERIFRVNFEFRGRKIYLESSGDTEDDQEADRRARKLFEDLLLDYILERSGHIAP